MAQGYIHSFETFGSVDGPGVRFVVFMQGCRMRCRYCHNPDTWKLGAGKAMDSDEVADKALKYRNYWGSLGGVTVSGGEALLQLEFVTALFKRLKQSGVNTCLDTAAGPFLPKKEYLVKFDELMRYTDLVLLDIKHIDPNKHKALTGIDNSHILECARHIDKLGVAVWIRHVLVPGLTDDVGDLKKLREFLDTLSNVKRVEVLPYHTLGIHKWEMLKIPYTLKGVEPPDDKSIEAAEQILGVKRA